MRLGFQYIIKNKGIDSEQEYNYTGENGECWTQVSYLSIPLVLFLFFCLSILSNPTKWRVGTAPEWRWAMSVSMVE